MRVLVVLCFFMGISLVQGGAKTWWAKSIVPGELYTAGQLTWTQLKQAADEGFGGVISLGNFIYGSSIGSDVIPRTAAAKRFVGSFTEMFYDVIDGGDVIDSLERFTYLMRIRPQPVLFHCKYSDQSTFISLLYLLKNPLVNSTFQPVTNPEDVFSIGDNLGYFYRRPELIELVSRIANVSLGVAEQPAPDHPWYQTMWCLRPVVPGIFISGQIRSNQIYLLEGKIRSFINARRAATTNGKSTQEEVTLLNIREGTGTYAEGGRQTETRLRNTRLNVSQANDFIAEDSDVNYQRVNELEYGDHIGYNESIARSHITRNYAFEYLHTPVGSPYGYEMKLWEAHNDVWLNAKMPVVFQCRTTSRAVVAAVLTVAYQRHQSSAWALNLAKDMGYPLSGSVATLYQQVLDNRMDSGDPNGSTTNVLSIVSIAIMFMSFIV
ncbi:hypothetical protein CAPTEDRAFT_195393 [Capitella teleta]|uniref:Uncharacterized protein n=1 Tax=Capitella teleta TaxID=283909 RepID=R7UC50_CAPTE|nr:hypothetical protein CAPTEDRAFT_195393 [Capitella teleta]|eukprot:ELU03696.1 hypothetical protein CAPTEDRAFT_195393 [Capitella teleta]